jgi:3-oxoacyl-[acyl-carrier protein] reductase
MTEPLGGRVAVVTGAGSGIGRASAVALAAAGATVVGADVDGDAAVATAEAIGGAARGVRVDVSRAEEVEALIEGTAREHGRLDVVVNNAGIMHEQLVADTTEDELDRVLAINLKGVFFGCRAAAKVMAGRGGSIVNMASAAVDLPAPKHACYGMSKAAVVQLTRTLAMEVGEDGIRVNAVAPGFIITGITARHFTNPDGTVDEERKAAVAKTFSRVAPLRRVGEPEDVADVVVFLASDASRYLTGQILRPNGGMAMPW